MRTSVKIIVEATDDSDFQFAQIPLNQAREWRVRVPKVITEARTKIVGEIHGQVVAFASGLIYDCSLQEHDELLALVKSRFDKGLDNKTLVAHSYAFLYTYFIVEAEFLSDARRELSPFIPSLDFRLREHPSMLWHGGPGKTYSSEQSQIYLVSRYAVLQRCLKYTLPELLKHNHFQDCIRALRERGLLDWQIMNAVFALTINFRLNSDPRVISDASFGDRLYRNTIEEGESPSDIIPPPDVYSLEMLLECHNANLVSSLKTFSLQLHQLTPDFPAINYFLDKRFRYYEDDIPHENPFPFSAA